MALNAPTADIQLLRRLYALPQEHKSVLLQLIQKFEYIKSKDILQQHIKNADNYLSWGNGENNLQKNKLPPVKKRYMFIYKKTAKQFTLEQVSKKFGTNKKTIYRWIYNKNKNLYKKYNVIKKLIF